MPARLYPADGGSIGLRFARLKLLESICALRGFGPPTENLLAVNSRSPSFKFALAISSSSVQVPFALSVIAVPAGLLDTSECAAEYGVRFAVKSVLIANAIFASEPCTVPAIEIGSG